MNINDTSTNQTINMDNPKINEPFYLTKSVFNQKKDRKRSQYMMGLTQRENKKVFNFTSKKPNELRASQPNSFIGSNNNFDTFLRNKDDLKL